MEVKYHVVFWDQRLSGTGDISTSSVSRKHKVGVWCNVYMLCQTSFESILQFIMYGTSNTLKILITDFCFLFRGLCVVCLKCKKTFLFLKHTCVTSCTNVCLPVMHIV
jgi:hypothetical protein